MITKKGHSNEVNGSSYYVLTITVLQYHPEVHQLWVILKKILIISSVNVLVLMMDGIEIMENNHLL